MRWEKRPPEEQSGLPLDRILWELNSRGRGPNCVPRAGGVTVPVRAVLKFLASCAHGDGESSV